MKAKGEARLPFVGLKTKGRRDEQHMRSLIIHSLKMRRVQTISVVLSITLSVAVILVLCLVYGGVMRGIEVSGQRGGAQIMVIPPSAEKYVTDTELLYTGVPAPMYMDQAIVAKVSAIDGIEQASPQFFSQTLDQSCCSATSETRLIGVDFASDFVIKPLLPNGSATDLADDEVVVGCRVDGIVDDKITIIGKQYRVAAIMAETGAELDASIVAGIDNARNISRTTAGYENYWKKYGDPGTLVSCIMVNATDDEAEYARVLNRLNLIGGISYVEHSQTAERAQASLSSVFVLLAGAAIIMIVISLVQLFARFYSCVWDRKSELSLYRAVGASVSQVRRIIGGEIACMVAVGLVFGFVCGALLSEGLMWMLNDSSAFPFVSLDILTVLGIALGIVALFALLASLAVMVPLTQIARLDPSFAMQQGDID